MTSDIFCVNQISRRRRRRVLVMKLIMADITWSCQNRDNNRARASWYHPKDARKENFHLCWFRIGRAFEAIVQEGAQGRNDYNQFFSCQFIESTYLSDSIGNAMGVTSRISIEILFKKLLLHHCLYFCFVGFIDSWRAGGRFYPDPDYDHGQIIQHSLTRFRNQKKTPFHRNTLWHFFLAHAVDR